MTTQERPGVRPKIHIVAPGENDVVLEVEPKYRVRGRVVDETGRGIPMRLVVATRDGERVHGRFTDEGGAFVLDHLGDGRWFMFIMGGVRDRIVVDIAGGDVTGLMIKSSRYAPSK